MDPDEEETLTPHMIFNAIAVSIPHGRTLIRERVGRDEDLLQVGFPLFDCVLPADETYQITHGRVPLTGNSHRKTAFRLGKHREVNLYSLSHWLTLKSEKV